MAGNNKLISITLDKERHLLFDMNSMASFEDVTNRSFFEFAQNMGKMTAKELRAFLWAGLVHEDKALTVEQVGSMISTANMGDIQKSLLTSVTSNLPEENKKKVIQKDTPG